MNNGIVIRENPQIGERCYYLKHESGLNIYFIPKNLATSFAVFSTRYGSVDSRFRYRGEEKFTVVPDGIAHYLEHKMFENEDGVDSFELFAKYGAKANAFTSFDKTSYLFSSTDNFYESLGVLLNLVTHPYFTPETVAKEQGIIGQEIAMIADNAENTLIFGLLGAMYKTHNVRIEIGGSQESIAKITAPLLYECYEKFYNLNNMSLCISGNQDFDKIVEVCDGILKKSEPYNVESECLEENAEVFEKEFVKYMDVPMPLFAIGVKDLNISPDANVRMRRRAAMQILSELLFGSSSKFYNVCYEDGYITDNFDLWSEHNRSFSMITLSAVGANPDKVFEEYKKYIAENYENGISRQDFERCKKMSYADFIRTFDSTSGIAYSIMDFVLDGADMLDYAETVSSLTYDGVNSLFRELFREEYTSYAKVLPKNKQ